MKVTSVQYVYIVSVSFYHMHRSVQPPSQPRDRTSMPQRWRAFVITHPPLSLYLWKTAIFHLFIYFLSFWGCCINEIIVYGIFCGINFFSFGIMLLRVIHVVVSMHTCVLSHFSHVQLFETLWTVSQQAPLFMGFSRQEYWSGLPHPPSADLPDPEIKTASFVSCIGWWVLSH